MYILHLFLLFENSILTKSLPQHPVISFVCFAVSNIDYFGFCDFPFFVVFLPIRALNSSIMSSTISTMPWLPNNQDQKLWTLCGCSFWLWGNVDSMYCIAWKSCNYFIYQLLLQSDTNITQHSRPKIVDPPLALIHMMGQRACCYWISLRRWPICYLYVSATNSYLHYAICQANNRWHCIHARSQNCTVTMSLPVLPIKAANTSVIHNSD